jgi:ribonuclease BN (tRNA processing enzyme)
MRCLSFAVILCALPAWSAPKPVPRLCAPQKGFSKFELAVLGSGGPGAAGRAASSYLVIIDGAPRILVDVGPGAFVRLGEMDIDLSALDLVLLTHLHIDHAGDVPGFVKARDLAGNQPMTFRFFGPEDGSEYPSTIEFVDKLFGDEAAFGYLTKFRNELHFLTADLPSQADAPIHEVLREGDLRITSIAVDHDDVPALAFRIEHAGRALVFSGDLASKTDNLARLAKGADLLVYDTSVLDPPGSPEGLYELHTAPHRIGEVASEAGVKSLLFSHIPPQVDRNKAAVLNAVKKTFKSTARFADDCRRIDLTRP